MTAVEAPVRATPEQARTLLMASLATLLVLVTFVTPLATGVRTTVDLAAGPGAQAWLLSAMSVGLAAALLTAGVLADDLGRRRVFAGGLAVVGAGAGRAGQEGVADQPERAGEHGGPADALQQPAGDEHPGRGRRRSAARWPARRSSR